MPEMVTLPRGVVVAALAKAWREYRRVPTRVPVTDPNECSAEFEALADALLDYSDPPPEGAAR